MMIPGNGNRKLLTAFRRFKFKSIYVKLFIFLMVSSVLLGMLSYLVLFVQQYKLNRAGKDYHQLLLDYNARNVDTEMLDISSLAQDLSISSSIHELLKTDVYSGGFPSIYERVSSYLSEMKATSPLINNLFICSVGSQCVIEASGTTSYRLFHSNRYSCSYEEWESLLMPDKNDFRLCLISVKEVLPDGIAASSLIGVIPVFFGRQYLGTVVIELNLHALHEMIAINTDYAGSAIAIFNSEFKYLAGNDDFIISDREYAMIKSDTGLSGNYEDDIHLCSYRKSASGSYYILVRTTKQLALARITRATGIFLFILSAILAGCVVWSFWYSGKLYSPIDNMLNYLDTVMDFPQLSREEGELTYIQNSLMKIERQRSTLSGMLSEGMPLIKQMLLLKLLMGDGNEETVIQIRKMNIGLEAGFFTVAVMETVVPPEEEKRQDDITAGGFLVQTGHVVSDIRLGDTRRVLVYSFKAEEERGDMILLLKKYAVNIESRRLGIAPLIGIGNSFESIAYISRSYEQAIRSLMHRKIGSCDDIYVYENEEAMPSDPLLHKDSLDRIHNCIRSGNISEAADYVTDFFSKVSPNAIFLEYRRAAFTLCQELRNIPLLGRGKDQFIEEVRKTEESIESSMDPRRIYQMLFSLYGNTVERYQKPENERLDRMLQYIDSNICKYNLCVKSVASEFNITSNYLTKYFKFKTGGNINKYINSKRIEKSKDLLKNTNMQVYKIAAKVGYGSGAVFIRTFEKYEGITPGEYRRSVCE